MSIDKVRIVNTNLHQRFFFDDSKQDDEEKDFEKSKGVMRQRSSQQTLKRLIKKGLIHYVKPYFRPQSSISINKQNLCKKQLKQSRIKTSTSKISLHSKTSMSQSAFFCSKNHQTGRRNTSQNLRVKTEFQQSPSNYLYKNKYHDQNDFDPSLRAFRQFRNISQQTINRINIENERRNFKIHEFKKVKYQNVWKKFTVPQKSTTTLGSRIKK